MLPGGFANPLKPTTLGKDLESIICWICCGDKGSLTRCCPGNGAMGSGINMDSGVKLKVWVAMLYPIKIYA